MQAQATTAQHGLFRCYECQEDWADELPERVMSSGLWMRITCKSCGNQGQLVTPLIPQEEPYELIV